MLNKNLKRVLLVSLISTVATHFIVSYLDKKDVLPKPKSNEKK